MHSDVYTLFPRALRAPQRITGVCGRCDRLQQVTFVIAATAAAAAESDVPRHVIVSRAWSIACAWWIPCRYIEWRIGCIEDGESSLLCGRSSPLPVFKSVGLL